MNTIFVQPEEVKKIRERIDDPILLCKILADVFRLNTISMIKEAGSGHPGSSLSSMDIITWLWIEEMKNPNEKNVLEGDLYFSSKGHDVPALYSLLASLGKLDFDLIHKLRKLGGLPGHPDISIPYVITNTGSLGMGISKARGMAKAKRLDGRRGNVFVLTGDGELQEGQIWESLQPTANQNFSEITVIVDCNKIQSDTWVEKVSDLNDLAKKFRSFGWEARECDGHNFDELKVVFDDFKKITERPKVLIANTIKGKGISFMENNVFPKDGEFYNYHSGAPSDEEYAKATEELLAKINGNLSEKINVIQKELAPKIKDKENRQGLIAAHGDELLKIGRENNKIVVLNADLLKDHALYEFKKQLPERFVECGIAEQDMVSMAGGLALEGKIPVVHSFACFLSTRPNEHIYNNATEKKKIIYIGTLAGLIPATPGHSHQSVRDISALGSIPGLTMIQPATEYEARKALRWAVDKNLESTYIRFYSIPFYPAFPVKEEYELVKGRGIDLVEGRDVNIFAYGPTMLNQAAIASDMLRREGVGAAVTNLPWLNEIDEKWLMDKVRNYKFIITIDDHYAKFGQGTLIASLLTRNNFMGKILSLGLDKIPVCGQADEVLMYHRLDGSSIALNIKNILSVT